MFLGFVTDGDEPRNTLHSPSGPNSKISSAPKLPVHSLASRSVKRTNFIAKPVTNGQTLTLTATKEAQRGGRAVSPLFSVGATCSTIALRSSSLRSNSSAPSLITPSSSSEATLRV